MRKSSATVVRLSYVWLREARDRANLTQAELAAELGVSERSLQEWEAGRAVPRAKHRRRLEAFRTQVEGTAA